MAIVVDYSPTVSDVGALLYLLSRPDVDVLAITLPVTGEAGCDLGVEVTLGILAMFDRDDVPVACDPEMPEGARSWPGEFLAGHENLAFGLPEPIGTADPRPAHEVIADTVTGSEAPVTLYAVAPLTNVARAFERSPDVVGQLGELVIMGGAVDAPGNVSGTGAEWNLWIDPDATAAVLSSGAPVTLVPLDATNDVPVPKLWRGDLEAATQSDAVAYLTTLVRLFPAVTSGFFHLWDELAAVVAAGEDIVTTEETALVAADGATRRDPGGASIVLANGVPDPDGFYAHFLETISGAAVEPRSTVTFDETTVPDEIDASSSPEEVLAAWLVRASLGDVDGAAELVAPDAPWVGWGATTDDFVDGNGPYQAHDMAVECASAGVLAACDLTFRDLWIDAIPELERGLLSVEAEIGDGTITAFRGFSFGPGIVEVFEAYGLWLEANYPTELEDACAANPAVSKCTAFAVSTVEEWVASR